MIKYLVSTLIVVIFAVAVFSQEKPFKFVDDEQVSVVNEQQETLNPPSNAKINISYKIFEAYFLSIGKAVTPFEQKTFTKLSRKNKKLASKIKKAHTAYEIRQNNEVYYFIGLNSIKYPESLNPECADSSACKIRGEAILIEIESKEYKETIMIIKSLKEFVRIILNFR